MNDRSTHARRWPDGVAVLLAMVFPTVLTWVYFVVLVGPTEPTGSFPNGPAISPVAEGAGGWQPVAYAVGKSIQFLFPVFWVLAIQRSRITWPRPRVAGLAAGLAFGLVVFVAALSAYHRGVKSAGFFQAARGEIASKLLHFGIRGPAAYFAMAAFYCVVHSFLEEYYWRWFVFGQLRRLVPTVAAVVLSSVAFMAHHVILLAAYFGWSSPVTYVFSLGVAIGGAFWAWLFSRSGSLYGPWLSHLLADAAIFAVGYDLVRPLFS